MKYEKPALSFEQQADQLLSLKRLVCHLGTPTPVRRSLGVGGSSSALTSW